MLLLHKDLRTYLLIQLTIDKRGSSFEIKISSEPPKGGSALMLLETALFSGRF